MAPVRDIALESMRHLQQRLFPARRSGPSACTPRTRHRGFLLRREARMRVELVGQSVIRQPTPPRTSVTELRAVGSGRSWRPQRPARRHRHVYRPRKATYRGHVARSAPTTSRTAVTSRVRRRQSPEQRTRPDFRARNALRDGKSPETDPRRLAANRGSGSRHPRRPAANRGSGSRHPLRSAANRGSGSRHPRRLTANRGSGSRHPSSVAAIRGGTQRQQRRADL